MRYNPGEALIQWWKTATVQQKWLAGILLFSLSATGLLLALSGLPVGNPSAAADFSSWYLVSAFFKVILVLALIIGGGVVLRNYACKVTPASQHRQLRLIETVRLSPRQSMHIVKAGDKTLLVGATDQGISMLSEVTLVESPVEETTGPHGKPTLPPELNFQSIFAALSGTK